MTPRIALSMLVAGVLAGLAQGYARNQAHADAAPPPPSDNGIGTSPSSDLMCVEPPPAPCGIWVDGSAEFADQRARAGEPPDVIVYTQGHTSCSDAFAIADTLWPWASAVFEVELDWRATVATSHPPSVAPVMMEWRAPAPRPARAPLKAGFPFLAVLAIVMPLIQTLVGKLFVAQVKDENRRTEIAGYADTAFHLVEALAPQLGLRGIDKYNRYIEEIVNSLKAAGKPELSGKEMVQLQQLASTKSLLAKPKPLPLPRAIALPLPPPPRG